MAVIVGVAVGGKVGVHVGGTGVSVGGAGVSVALGCGSGVFVGAVTAVGASVAVAITPVAVGRSALVAVFVGSNTTFACAVAVGGTVTVGGGVLIPPLPILYGKPLMTKSVIITTNTRPSTAKTKMDNNVLVGMERDCLVGKGAMGVVATVCTVRGPVSALGAGTKTVVDCVRGVSSAGIEDKVSVPVASVATGSFT